MPLPAPDSAAILRRCDDGEIIVVEQLPGLAPLILEGEEYRTVRDYDPRHGYYDAAVIWEGRRCSIVETACLNSGFPATPQFYPDAKRLGEAVADRHARLEAWRNRLPGELARLRRYQEAWGEPGLAEVRCYAKPGAAPTILRVEGE